MGEGWVKGVIKQKWGKVGGGGNKGEGLRGREAEGGKRVRKREGERKKESGEERKVRERDR